MSDVTKEQLDALKVRIYDALEANENLGKANELMTKALTDIVKSVGLTGEQITYDSIVEAVAEVVKAQADAQSDLVKVKAELTAAQAPVEDAKATVSEASEPVADAAAVTTGEAVAQ